MLYKPLDPVSQVMIYYHGNGEDIGSSTCFMKDLCDYLDVR